MIKMFRIDERLIHGQIAIKWSRHTGVDHIVVGNDAAANSPIIQKSLKMAAPAGIKTAIRGVDDAIALLNDPALREYENPDAGQQSRGCRARCRGCQRHPVHQHRQLWPDRSENRACRASVMATTSLRRGGSGELQASDRDRLEMIPIRRLRRSLGRGYYQPV